MTPFDPKLQEIALLAKVRPSHVFHCWHALASAPEAFDPNAFAEFCQLDVRHITAIVAALSAQGMLPPEKAAQRAKAVRGTRLPEAFQIPPEWLEWAREKRFWTLVDARAEADLFVDFWQAKSGRDAVKLDWEATWRNWVRNSRRKNGDRSPQAEITHGTLAEHYEKQAALYDRLGRWQEATELRAKAGQK